MDENSVAESGQAGSLHPTGAPIAHSTNEGDRRRPVDGLPASDRGLVGAPLDRDSTTGLSSPQCRELALACSLATFARGVGNSRTAALSGGDLRASCGIAATLSPSCVVGVGNSDGEDPIAEVRGTEGCRGKAIPLDTEPERGQLPDHLSPDGSVMESKDVRHVLHEHVAGSKLANGSSHLSPQNGLGVVEPVSLASRRSALAGEPSGDDVDTSNSVSSDESHVGDDRHAGPTSLEDFASPRIELAQPFVPQPGAVQPVGEQAAAVEQASNCEVMHVPSDLFCLQMDVHKQWIGLYRPAPLSLGEGRRSPAVD
jgi:hypothetical protein